MNKPPLFPVSSYTFPMKHFTRLSSLVAALCLGLPAAGFANDHGHGGSHGGWSGGHGNWNGGHGNWHGGNWHNNYCYSPRVHFYGGYSPFAYSYYPYYSAPYYDSYYASPAIGLSITSSPTYRGTRAGDQADDLAIDVQRALRRDGYYRGSIDGDVGAGTRAAIRQYQYDHHLEVTGRVDRSLLRSLGLD